MLCGFTIKELCEERGVTDYPALVSSPMISLSTSHDIKAVPGVAIIRIDLSFVKKLD